MIIGNHLYRLNEPIKIWFEPRDIWVGVYWKHKDIRGEMFVTDIYVCVLPMLPMLISVVVWRKSAQLKRAADLLPRVVSIICLVAVFIWAKRKAG
jgi:hypothetical protein